MMGKWRAAAISGGMVFCLLTFHLFAPPQHVPWKPLDLSHPVGWATGGKIDRLANDPSVCFAALEAIDVEYSRIENSPPGEPCGFYDALHLERSATPYSAPLRATCPLAAALQVWERQVLQPYAQEHFGEGVARIETYGTFSCRRIYGSETGRFSEHARSNAIDISGFTLQSGERVSVLSHWNDGGPKAAFLDDVFDGACAIFRVGLSPEYNAAHEDHFHFDLGTGFTCF